ncbi:Tat pathway signal sequence [Stomatohabitans albus]|uniref:Tat pathway signal sequence n=1 Tax=Stomatohabitans albus TaxID=3110766 RepID=UPI00300CDBFC
MACALVLIGVLMVWLSQPKAGPAPETSESSRQSHVTPEPSPSTSTSTTRPATPSAPPSVPTPEPVTVGPVVAPLHGLTVDSVDDLDALVASVSALSHRPTLRMVFEADRSPADYAAAVTALEPYADLMGLVLDSTAMAQLSVPEVTARTQAFVDAFAHQIAIWEVGNEVNGEWVGAGPDEIVAKVAAANRVVKAAGEPSAITFNYWSGPDCYAEPWEVGATFVTHVPADMAGAVDLVMLSVYETACDPPQQPSATQLAGELTMLGQVFGNAKLGIGEIGAQGVDDDLPTNPTFAEKERIAQRYMGMAPELRAALGDRFVGGWFWWYFVEDAVPKDKPESLWPVLNELA